MVDQELLQAIGAMMDAKIAPINDRLDRIDARLDRVEERLERVERRVTRLEVQHENDVMPLLRTISQCYVDTYDRYRRDADRMEAALDDIDTLKRVVADHSRRLNKLAI